MNVIWFCLDTLRADHLSCYEYFRKTSPTIDALASEGVLFPDSRANAVATGPAFTSMFTGQYAVNNEWYLTPFDVGNLINFPDDRPVFTEAIQDRGGITTAAFDNLFQFASHMKQFVRGFEYYVNVTRSSKPIHHHVVGGSVNERLLPWIRMHKDENFFLFVHYWDPHGPYNQPDEYARPFVHERGNLDDLYTKKAKAGYEYVPGWGPLDNISHTEGPEEFVRSADSPFRHPRSIDSYDGEILYTDFLIKQVIEELDGCNILDDTVVIINADHGEQLNQHYDMWGHAGLHDANIFTPLIMWRPGLLPAGSRPQGFVHHIDIAPTILDLLQAEIPESMDGESLLPLISGKTEGRTAYFSETMGMRSIYEDGWKYIQHKFGRDELYDLSSDPMEVVNLVDERRDTTEALREKLRSWVRRNLGDRNDPMLYQLARSEELRGQIRQQL
jgi:arylsulfatase